MGNGGTLLVDIYFDHSEEGYVPRPGSVFSSIFRRLSRSPAMQDRPTLGNLRRDNRRTRHGRWALFFFYLYEHKGSRVRDLLSLPLRR